MALSAYQMPEDKRDTKRQRLMLTARMIDAHGETEVHLLNVSRHGAKLDADLPPVRDQQVTLVYHEFRVDARVAWVEGNRFGLAFDRPIDEEQLLRAGPNAPA